MLKRSGFLGLALAAALASNLGHAWSALPVDAEGPEVSPAAAGLLKLVNTGAEEALRRAPGMRPDVVARILTHRASGRKFKNLLDLWTVAKMNKKDVEDALQPFQDAEDAKAIEAQRKPVPEPPATGKPGGRLQKGERSPTPAEQRTDQGTGAGPIVLVRPGFYGKLPGFENLDTIDPLLKTEFLETVNREMCTCGCKNETIAFCLVNDPSCPVVKARARKIYDDIVNRPR